MTLIVSLRIPDGIVIAGDSLSTVSEHGQLEGEINLTCPSCNKSHKIPHKNSNASHDSNNTFLYTKDFPLW